MSLFFPNRYPQNVINCIAACSAIDEAEPVQYLSSNKFNHEIKEVIVSKVFDDSLQVKYMICDCSISETKKQLLVAFCETKYMTDFIFDIQHYGEIIGINGGFHSGVNSWSLQIPIDFFVKKTVEESYEVIFTGNRIGAAIASIVAARLMFHEKLIQKKRQENILFIGFGSPKFVSVAFQLSIEKNEIAKQRFNFYEDESNQIIPFLNNLMNHLYLDRTLYLKPNS